MSIPNPIPHKTLYINDYICSCYAFVFILEFSEYISKHILQFHSFPSGETKQDNCRIKEKASCIVGESAIYPYLCLIIIIN